MVPLFACLGSLAAAQGEALEFSEVAPGVWRATVGSPEDFDLMGVGGGAPKTAALDRLPAVELPERALGMAGHVSDARTSLRFPLAPGVEVYGLGLDFEKVRQNGRIHELRVDHWGGTTGRTHAPVPFFITSEGWGVLVNSARYLKVYAGTALRVEADPAPDIRDRNRASNWQAHPPSDSVEVLVPAAGAEVFLFAGSTPLEVVQRYVLYGGGGCLPPRWGLGFTHRMPTRTTSAELLAEVQAFEDHGFPLDFVGLEPGWHSHAYPCSFEWDLERYPDPKATIEALHRRGVRSNLWMNPYVLPDSPLAKRLEPYRASHRVWNGEVIDFEIEAARKLFGEHLDRVTLDIGVDGFKVDEVDGFDRWLWPDTAEFPSGLDAEQIRQTYGLRVQRIIDDLFRARDKRTFGLARATNAGGSHLPFVIYNDHYSHREFIVALCNSSFCGVLWTPEVRSSDSPEEWLRRMQTVCVSPMAMLNAWASGTKPWTFPGVEDAVRETALFRMRLMPYLYTAFARYHNEGRPPVRAMPLVDGFAEVADAATRRRFLGDQFLVGDDLLCAPLFAGETEREVLLPRGRWYDFHTGELVGSGGVIPWKAAGDAMPLFVRDGALIPLGDARLHAPSHGEPVPMEVRYYGEAPGRGRLYHDDGTSFAYERGELHWIELTAVRDDDGDLSTDATPAASVRAAIDGPIQWRSMTPTSPR